MATAAALRTGLETRLKTIAGITVYKRWPNQLQFPCAIIGRGQAQPEQSFGSGALTRWEFTVSVMVSLAPGYEQAQDALDPYIQTSSTGGVFRAITADRTLGSMAHSTFVRDFLEDDQVDLNESLSALSYTANIEVWAS